jgi:asparagine synthase (glutamine-hydrolysing)
MNTDSRYEETDMVEAAVKELGIRHTKVSLGVESFLPNLRRLVYHHDAPVYTITYYVHWMLMKSIAEKSYRISLSGTGADELFTGYFDHHLAYLSVIRADANLFKRAQEDWERYIRPIVRNPFLQNANAFIENPQMRDHIYLHSDSFSARLVHPWHEAFQERQFSSDLLRNRMLNEMFHETVPPILHEDDMNAMFFSIENRSPFLDRSLFEFACRIPTRHLIENGYAKSILREAMRGIVPDAILDSRRKVGFNAPIFSLLDNRNPDVRAEILSESPIYDLVQKNAIASLLDQSDLPNSESKFLFSFLNAKYFMEAFA